jgi:hypothetical protein
MDGPPPMSDDPRDISLIRCGFDDIKQGKYYYTQRTWLERGIPMSMWDRMHVTHKDLGMVYGDASTLVNRGIRLDPPSPEGMLNATRGEVTAEVPAVSGRPRVICHFYIPTPLPNFVPTTTSKQSPRGVNQRKARSSSRSSRSRKNKNSRKSRR